ncbi:heterokaryon incompatibility protein-domain-containing protein [Cladorrhinum samala]|uniref:Heterokaryon incompatibility protein-domain-containing protein n=1 Tax=Cladorrhinum samala TaxID=585594 RepID=A0AAV9HGT4_9PEZI|nr:heterokaryon incompatibility protein-domain-containing protein [Cladorrhinum samala]
MGAETLTSYLEGWGVGPDQVSRKSWHGLTFQNPHSCRHCEMIKVVLTVKEYIPEYCSACHKILAFTTNSDGVRACSLCGTLWVTQGTEQSFSGTANYRLAEAVEAALSGCAFYHWVVGCLASRLMGKDKGFKLTPAAAEKLSQWYRFDFFGVGFQPQTSGSRTIECLFTQDELGNEADSELMESHRKDIGLGKGPGLNRIGSLDAWTTSGTGNVSQQIEARPYHKHVGSDVSFNFARDCFRTCLDTHPWCRSDQISILDQERTTAAILPEEQLKITDVPTRLIDTQHDGSNLISLVETASDSVLLAHVSRSGFMALSYCWGGDQPVKLTQATHTSLSKGFSISKLPQTLQDTVSVAREMGLRYVWIDCLCIYQDSDSDKANEISRMASYYGRATLTLCAASARKCVDGFLRDREDSPFAAGPFKLQCQGSANSHHDSIEGNIYLVKEYDAPLEPICTRAWTLQEALLSRRILIFGLRQLYWSCVNSYAGVGGEFTDLTDRRIPPSVNIITNINTIGTLIYLPVDTQWKSIVEDYTLRQLDWGSDKLLAVSAVAKHMVDVSRHRGGDALYIAGLLVDLLEPTMWLSQLLWYPADPSTTARPREPGYRAPSWSWASIDGQIILEAWNRRRGDTREAYYATVESYEADLAFEGAPFGALKGAHIILSANMLPFCHLEDAMQSSYACVWKWNKGDPSPWRDENSGQDASELVLVPDCSQDRDAIEDALRGENNTNTRHFLVAFQTRGGSGVRGIIVGRCDDLNDPSSYRRKGCFHLRGPHREEIRHVFSRAEKRTIRIV